MVYNNNHLFRYYYYYYYYYGDASMEEIKATEPETDNE